MDKLSNELIHLIFEDACCADIQGKIARSLCLVSKRFRAIGESFVFRHVSISGPDQVKRFVARVERLGLGPRSDDAAIPGVQHLFLCDYTKEHALYNDTFVPCDNEDLPSFSVPILSTMEGERIRNHYEDARDEFWFLVGHVLKVASPTLRTLTLLSYHEASRKHARQNQKAINDIPTLANLSGTNINFPLLQRLTLRLMLGCSTEEWMEANLSPIDAPLLQDMQLIIRSPFLRSRTETILYPLLRGMHSRHPFLKQLIFLCNLESHSFEEIMGVICGDVDSSTGSLASECIKNRVLPEKLTSVVIKTGDVPMFLCGGGYSMYMEEVSECIENVANRGIAGLYVAQPIDNSQDEGKREYECLLREWEEGKFEV